MEAMVVNNLEISAVSLPTNVGRNKRRTTDKYWIVLFFVAIYIWVVARPQVVHVKSGSIIDPDNNTLANITSECVQRKTKSDTTIITKAASLYVSRVLGKYWLFDVFTCNPGFLDKNYNQSGSIVIWVQVLFCSGLLIYSFTSMRTDEMYRKQFLLSIMTLAPIAIFIQEILIMKFIQDTNPMSGSEFIFNVILWFIPIIILGLIGRTIHVSLKRDDTKKNHDDDDDDDDNDGDGDYDDDSNDSDNDNSNDNQPSIKLLFYLHLPVLYIIMLIYIPFTISLFTIFDHEMELKYKLVWSSEWIANGIVITAGCYMVLIIYYFLLMVISCSTNISYERRESPKKKDFFLAVLIVARYHFGTACYHATFIFPRIHATFVMNEKEFRENKKFSLIYRLYLTHWKIPNFSSSLIAACGYSHSKSIRESLRLFNIDSLKSKKFQTFNQTNKCCSALLMMIHSLILISLWTHGVTVNPNFATVIWLAYLLAIYIASLIMRIYDAVTDVIWYLDDGTITIKF